MSTTVVRYIPEDPDYVAEPAAIEAARALLQKALGSPAVATTTEGATFVDPGENLDTIRCPACGDELDMDWWQGEMARAGKRKFACLDVTVPCCGAETSLHDLDYDMPAGFAHMVLAVQDPKGDPDEVVDLDALERLLGCVVRRIDARY
jgi:hypothetical protein